MAVALWLDGVDIFFVLSGFLIGSQLLRQLKDEGRVGLADFYARRAWRIAPAYAVVLAAYGLFPVLREAPGLDELWKFASFTLNLLIDFGHKQAFSHAWSLCVEEHFYLLFPLLAWGLSRRISMAGVLCLGAALLALGVLLRGATWLHWDALDASRSWFVECMYYPTWMRLDGLLVGVLLAALRVHRPEVWARLLQRSNGFLLLGLAVFALALLLFRERTGLLANTLGWRVRRSWSNRQRGLRACTRRNRVMCVSPSPLKVKAGKA